MEVAATWEIAKQTAFTSQTALAYQTEKFTLLLVSAWLAVAYGGNGTVERGSVATKVIQNWRPWQLSPTHGLRLANKVHSESPPIEIEVCVSLLLIAAIFSCREVPGIDTMSGRKATQGAHYHYTHGSWKIMSEKNCKFFEVIFKIGYLIFFTCIQIRKALWVRYVRSFIHYPNACTLYFSNCYEPSLG